MNYETLRASQILRVFVKARRRQEPLLVTNMAIYKEKSKTQKPRIAKRKAVSRMCRCVKQLKGYVIFSNRPLTIPCGPTTAAQKRGRMPELTFGLGLS